MVLSTFILSKRVLCASAMNLFGMCFVQFVEELPCFNQLLDRTMTLTLSEMDTLRLLLKMPILKIVTVRIYDDDGIQEPEMIGCTGLLLVLFRSGSGPVPPRPAWFPFLRCKICCTYTCDCHVVIRLGCSRSTNVTG